MLRSQDGVEQVEEAYANLKHGLIKVKTRADKKIDLAQLVRVLEKDVGFEPVTAVTLELRGRLQRREGKLFFEAAESGQTFVVESVEGGTENLPDASLPIVATLVDPHAADRIALRRPKMESGRQPPASGENATARLSISGMT